MSSINTGTLKQQNQSKILQLLRLHPGLTKQDIASTLSLSMPTVLQSINELLDKEILEICGTNESTGGRKAQRIQLNKDCGFTVGINIAQHHVRFAIIDFTNTPICTYRLPLCFCDEPTFYEKLSSALSTFLENEKLLSSKILGIGISFPGIIDSEKNMITRSHVFQLENISLDRFQNAISYPLIVANDANCCSSTELNLDRENYFYLALNETVGGALIRNRSIIMGNKFQTGEAGHMILVPKGLACYCGKNGCADAYLSPKVLCNDINDLDNFFATLQTKNPSAIQAFDTYLDYLALLISNIRMLLDTHIIIGGDMAFYLEYYLDQLKEYIKKYDYFARDIDYVSICRQKKSARAIGAGILALEKFGSSVLL